ncbi:glycosyltransferase family 2 protein [Thermococcus gorgonarius]|uniref:Glycosyltransferase 2-like domain-containing protein n=1 Tax=Thermococcus gorgonarius TaxID=71997 RepID=A0A2Z2M489_THEGO|nr:glycosyltransferase [Thermococcus gorgonarius]ASI99975.1 hypothetical protein A3K92_00015 [Thermococcus gorgonarius]
MVTVSVIIPTVQGRENLLKRAIQSVLNQTFQDLEIIIVGNPEKESIQKSLKDDRIIILNEPNANVSEARNIGMKHARGEYIAFLDDDDEWIESKLEKQVKLFKESKIGLVYTHYLKILPNGTILREKQECISGKVYKKLITGNFIGTSTVMIRRDVIKRVGFFDESLKFAEDWDYWLRISQKYPVGCIPEPLAKYYLSSNLREKHRVYFSSFGNFVKKWWNATPVEAKKLLVLRWLWYEKTIGRVSLSDYWLMKFSVLFLNRYNDVYKFLSNKIMSQ